MMKYELKSDGYYREGIKVSEIYINESTGHKFYYTYNELCEEGIFKDNVIDAFCSIKKALADELHTRVVDGVEYYLPLKYVDRVYGEHVRQNFLRDNSYLDAYYVVAVVEHGKASFVRSDLTVTYNVAGAKRVRRQSDADEFLEAYRTSRSADYLASVRLVVKQVIIHREYILTALDVYKVAMRKYEELGSVEAVMEWLNIALDCGNGELVAVNGLIYYRIFDRNYILSKYCTESISVTEEYVKEISQLVKNN